MTQVAGAMECSNAGDFHSPLAHKGSFEMLTLPTILVCGRDNSLLNTRRFVLEVAGYRVLTAQTSVEAERLAAVEFISLLLLCHSLSIEDCEKILAAVDMIQPEMKRLFMTTDPPLCARLPIDRVISALEGPRALIAAVDKLVPKSMN